MAWVRDVLAAQGLFSAFSFLTINFYAQGIAHLVGPCGAVWRETCVALRHGTYRLGRLKQQHMREMQEKRYWLVGASEGLGKALALKLNRAEAEVIQSSLTAFCGLPGSIGYTASKAATLSLAECMYGTCAKPAWMFRCLCPIGPITAYSANSAVVLDQSRCRATCHIRCMTGESDMLKINTDKIAEVIILARDMDRSEREFDAFITRLNEEEQASLVAVMWIGRDSFDADEYDEAYATARSEATTRTEDYLKGSPHPGQDGAPSARQSNGFRANWPR